MRRLDLEPWIHLGGIVRAIVQLHNYEIINLFKISNHILPGSLYQQSSCCSIYLRAIRDNFSFILIILSLDKCRFMLDTAVNTSIGKCYNRNIFIVIMVPIITE